MFSNDSVSNQQVAWRFTLLAVIIALVGYRVMVLISSEISLFYDEAYYYYWSLTPDWGYYSKPPMVAWLISLTSLIDPGKSWTTKLAAPLLYGATAFVVGLIGKRLYNDKTALFAGLIFISMPVVSFNSFFITTDAPLLFFWSLTIYLFILALEDGSWRYWLMAGACCGLGLLSKYTMVVLPFSIFLFLLLSHGEHRQQRNLLLGAKFWLTALVALAVFLPNLWWNSENNFISFVHTKEISHLERDLFHPDKLLEFFLAQFIVFGPIAMGIFCYLVAKPASYKSHHSRLLMMLSLPLLVIISSQALLTRANANWAAPVFVASSVLVGKHLAELSQRRWLWIAISFNLVLMAAFYHYHSVLSLAGIEPSRRNDPYQRILGWPELGKQLTHWRQKYPEARLLSKSRDLLAYFGYYTEPPFARKLAVWSPDTHIANHYQLVANVALYPNEQFLLVLEKPIANRLSSTFGRVEFLEQMTVDVYPDFQRTVYVYYAQDFLGYGEPQNTIE